MEKYRGTVQACRYGVQKVKAKLALNLASDVKEMASVTT